MRSLSPLCSPHSALPIRSLGILLLTVHAGLLANLALRYSPTIDEVGHLPAGLYTWEFGRFDLYRVNPPLVRTLAALPVWLANPACDWTAYRTGLTARPEWEIGRDFLQANSETSFRYFTGARWMLIPISLLGGVICAIWAARLYGEPAGIVALTLWCFSPTILGYGALITPDLSAAALGIAAGYAFWRWLSQPTWTRTIVAGLALGLAELTKTTWIILFPLWPLLWLIWNVGSHRRPSSSGLSSMLNAQRSTRLQLAMLAAILMIGLYVLNVGYGFRGTLKPLGEYQFVSLTLSGRQFAERETQTGDNRFADSPLAALPVPLPRDYLTGIDLQKWDLEQRGWSYLRGEWKRGGWWWYYLYALGIKEPLGTWCLLALALLATRLRTSPDKLRSTAVLLLPAAGVMILVSSQTGSNRYLRYVLPALPFLFVWGSQAVRLVTHENRWWAVPVGGAVLWSVTGSLSVYPDSLSFFNQAVGGPDRGHQHVIDANVDWGQDLFLLREWIDSHPEARPLSVICQPFVPLDVLGIEQSRPAAPLPPGWYVVSRHDRHARSGEFNQFATLEPVDEIGESMDVYHIPGR